MEMVASYHKIRFPDAANEVRALGFLGRAVFRSKHALNGETARSESALAALAVEGIPFTSCGRATYEQNISAIRVAPTTSVQ